MVLFYLPKKNTKRVGFTATKKLGNAVKRNRAKRLLRALFIQNAASLKEGEYIFVAKPQILQSEFAVLRKHFYQNLKRAHVLKK